MSRLRLRSRVTGTLGTPEWLFLVLLLLLLLVAGGCGGEEAERRGAAPGGGWVQERRAFNRTALAEDALDRVETLGAAAERLLEEWPAACREGAVAPAVEAAGERALRSAAEALGAWRPPAEDAPAYEGPPVRLRGDGEALLGYLDAMAGAGGAESGREAVRALLDLTGQVLRVDQKVGSGGEDGRARFLDALAAARKEAAEHLAAEDYFAHEAAALLVDAVEEQILASERLREAWDDGAAKEFEAWWNRRAAAVGEIRRLRELLGKVLRATLEELPARLPPEEAAPAAPEVLRLELRTRDGRLEAGAGGAWFPAEQDFTPTLDRLLAGRAPHEARVRIVARGPVPTEAVMQAIDELLARGVVDVSYATE